MHRFAKLITKKSQAETFVTMYSGNQKFCILKSRLLKCHIFHLGAKLFCLSRWKAEILSIFMIFNFVKPNKIIAYLQNFYILGHLTNQI